MLPSHYFTFDVNCKKYRVYIDMYLDKLFSKNIIQLQEDYIDTVITLAISFASAYFQCPQFRSDI
jgi:hypothetical protein